jgi:hypothetical protein
MHFGYFGDVEPQRRANGGLPNWAGMKKAKGNCSGNEQQRIDRQSRFDQRIWLISTVGLIYCIITNTNTS